MFLEWFFLPALALLLFLGMLALQELGLRTGRRALTPDADPGSSGTGAVEASVFALLGLILAFGFNGAGSRLETRRSLLVQEANAIGTVSLRLDLLPPGEQAPIRERLRRYLDARIATYEAIPNMQQVRENQRLAGQLQGEIWTAVVQAHQRNPLPGVNLLLIPALNDMIDVTTSRDTAALTHGSWFVSAFMIALCLLAALVAGRAMARSAKRPLFHVIVFAALTAFTVYVILDLDYPRIGLIRIGVANQALFELQRAIQ